MSPGRFKRWRYLRHMARFAFRGCWYGGWKHPHSTCSLLSKKIACMNNTDLYLAIDKRISNAMSLHVWAKLLPKLETVYTNWKNELLLSSEHLFSPGSKVIGRFFESGSSEEKKKSFLLPVWLEPCGKNKAHCWSSGASQPMTRADHFWFHSNSKFSI